MNNMKKSKISLHSMRIFLYVTLYLQAIDATKLSKDETSFVTNFLEQQGLDNILIVIKAGSKISFV